MSMMGRSGKRSGHARPARNSRPDPVSAWLATEGGREGRWLRTNGCGSTRSSDGSATSPRSSWASPGTGLAGRPDRRRPAVRQPRSGRAFHGGRGGVRRHPARRLPEPRLQGGVHPARLPARRPRRTGLPRAGDGGARPEGLAAGEAAAVRRRPPSRSPNWAGDGSGRAVDGRPLVRAAGGRRAGAAVPQAVRRHAVPAGPLGVRRDRRRLARRPRRRAAPARRRDRLVPDRRRAGVHHGLLPVPQLGRRGRTRTSSPTGSCSTRRTTATSTCSSSGSGRSGDRWRAPSGGR